ncbi:CP, partial [Cervus elaphus hippelaphus]
VQWLGWESVTVRSDGVRWGYSISSHTEVEPGRMGSEVRSEIQEHTINGYLYGNLPGLTMCAEDRVKWHLISMGSLLDIHPIYFHGQTLISQTHRRDTITVFPASMRDAFMVAKGALYPDNTTGLQKEDDRLQPGAEYTYVWFVEENQGPGPSDSNCVTRMYHSHVDTLRDVSSGLIGPILTCKRGTLDGDMEKYIDEYFILVFSITDENRSWYIDDNILMYTEAGQVDANDPDFEESNIMRCTTFLRSWSSAETMQAFFIVRDCQKSSADVTGTQVVHYYIAAREIFWDYAPSGIDFFSGNSLTEAGSESRFYFEQGPSRIGGTYKKLVYFEYTDASFQTQKAKATHLGLLEEPHPSNTT